MQGKRVRAMDLKLYDTLTREKRVFTPLDPANVRMYVCGPTVYDFAHIGNARPVIVFDVLFRLLRHLYGPDHVTYVRNITDVDDKINARAAERLTQRGEAGGDLNAEIRRLTEETYANFKADVAALGCLPPTVEPRATEHIDEMKALIERLVASGHAYVAEDHVLFAVASMPDYGKLSKRPLDEMIAGARVEVAPYKRDPMDFVLWKPSRLGEPAWPSPCGIAAPGRPGWHIECSAMSDHWLWTKAEPRLSPAGLAHPHQFDIHGGGVDLVFPHHENEIAQSRCAFHTPVMANYWMHNGFLMVEGEKMAKSLGNFITIRELLNAWPGEAIRLAMLQTHYRQPINWTAAGLREAKRTLDHWYALTADTAPGFFCADMLDALADDLNTPKALAALHELRTQAAQGAKGAAACLKASAQAIGLLQHSAAEWSAWRPQSLAIDEERIAGFIAARNAARKGKNFTEADRIRDELFAMGIVLKDTKDGTTWEVAR
jgi:cysteinyl-tRNA synthetase